MITERGRRCAIRIASCTTGRSIRLRIFQFQSGAGFQGRAAEGLSGSHRHDGMYGTDVLEAAGIAGRNRIREIDEKVYLRELFRKFGRNRNSVYLLADTQDNLEVLQEIVSNTRTIS